MSRRPKYKDVPLPFPDGPIVPTGSSMTESAWTSKILARVRADHPSLPLVWKINDRSTPGVPDVLIVDPHHRVWWFEMKAARDERTPVDTLLSPQQLRRWTKLASPRGWIVVRRPSDGRFDFYCSTDRETVAFSTPTIAAAAALISTWIS